VTFRTPRSGIGILPRGDVIFYSTGNLTDAHGASYGELRALMKKHLAGDLLE
jgi:hypothetical protein